MTGGKERRRGSSLAGLRRAYGRAYFIRGDDELGFMATRRDTLGILKAQTRDEMLELLAGDYHAHPVPREYDASATQRPGTPGTAPGAGLNPVHGETRADEERLSKEFPHWSIWSKAGLWYARPEPQLCSRLCPRYEEWALRCGDADQMAATIDFLHQLPACPYCGEAWNPLDPAALPPGPPPGEQLLSPAQAAEMARVTPGTVTRWAKSGKLTPVFTAGGRRRYRDAEVRGLLGLPVR
jgi:hypothetical protein